MILANNHNNVLTLMNDTAICNHVFEPLSICIFNVLNYPFNATNMRQMTQIIDQHKPMMLCSEVFKVSFQLFCCGYKLLSKHESVFVPCKGSKVIGGYKNNK